jgi:hypothetical protein
MDAASNAQLLAYFKDREVWLLNADSLPQRLQHYSTDSTSCRPEPDPK